MKKIGILGEKIAVKYVKKQKYKVLEKNFSTKYGEIDIIAKHEGYICFIEVKTRNLKDKALPSEYVDQAKQKKIYNTAEMWLCIKKIQSAFCRFDIVSIIMDEKLKAVKIDLIQNAFMEG